VVLVETQFAYDGFEVIGFHFLKAPSFDIDRGERFVAKINEALALTQDRVSLANEEQ